ncbi:hypothetical protein A2714_04340 [Candidatus Woesebacteria bacterium RIFCSPHIGHO2_01_FULL_38_9]|uniref:Anti-sigma factor n=1 Tax=Candidatus Woesebacteria bacterium RIFCSPHIGHO2_01_FULL_38_9 TaxID=1802492 RepID=A0A1F7XY32_9BACT|nr:MAG: hypothetical protein A2714_04340 [Candidatus Woesebacteria bacterium RIFCSPHIGHO2_01_FULL_38_9]
MNRRDIVIGLLILLSLAGVIYYRQKTRPTEEMRVPETLSSSEEVFEEKFKIDIPDDISKSELKDISGGNATGIATRNFENAVFSHTVLADLPDPQEGKFYEGWLVRADVGSENFSQVSTGRMQLAKGGWMLNFESKIDYSDHGKVVITEEERSDATPEKYILEGTF